MRNRSKWPPLFIVALFLAAGTATLFAPDAGSGGACVASAISDARTIPDITGTWEGTWEDTIYQATGSMSWTIVQEGSEMFGMGTIDVTQAGGGVHEGLGSGAIIMRDRQTLTFTFEGDMLGEGTGVLSGTACTGGGTVGSPLNYGAFTYHGAITETNAEGRFFFTPPSGGAGRVLMTNTTPVEPTTWGDIKAGYRNDVE